MLEVAAVGERLPAPPLARLPATPQTSSHQQRIFLRPLTLSTAVSTPSTLRCPADRKVSHSRSRCECRRTAGLHRWLEYPPLLLRSFLAIAASPLSSRGLRAPRGCCSDRRSWYQRMTHSLWPVLATAGPASGPEGRCGC